MNLLDLGHDELRQVFMLLGPRDICSGAMSCKKLKELANLEDFWEAACMDLVRNPSYSSLQQEDWRYFKRWLNASSFQVIYRLLVKLNCWPEGIWRCSMDHSFPNGNTDGSLTVIVRKENGMLRATSSSRSAQDAVVLDFQLQERGAKWPALCLLSSENQSAGQYPLDLCLAKSHQRVQDDTTLMLQICHLDHIDNKSFSQPWVPSGATAPLMQNSYMFCCNLPGPPWPEFIPAVDYDERAHSALHIPRQLQGIWEASYGPHGDEIIWVTFQQDPREALPLRYPHYGKLQGLKITGDPNVPAGKLTFEVWSQYPVVGRYNGFEEEEFLDGQIMEVNRNIVMHSREESVLVNIEERPVAARYFGRGQINANPRRWAPEWEEVQLLVYEGQRPLFSILWSDLGYPSRHIMDFTPAELPGFSTRNPSKSAEDDDGQPP